MKIKAGDPGASAVDVFLSGIRLTRGGRFLVESADEEAGEAHCVVLNEDRTVWVDKHGNAVRAVLKGDIEIRPREDLTQGNDAHR